jgi:hypothetical protein
MTGEMTPCSFGGGTPTTIMSGGGSPVTPYSGLPLSRGDSRGGRSRHNKSRTRVDNDLSPPVMSPFSASSPQTSVPLLFRIHHHPHHHRKSDSYFTSHGRSGSSGSLSSGTSSKERCVTIAGMKIIKGQRPVTCLNHSLNDTRPDYGKDLAGGVALLTCGPPGLIDAVSRLPLAIAERYITAVNDMTIYHHSPVKQQEMQTRIWRIKRELVVLWQSFHRGKHVLTWGH